MSNGWLTKLDLVAPGAQEGEEKSDASKPDDAAVSVDLSVPKESLRTSVLRIGGLTCASCVANVENGVKNVDGIVSINVNLMTGVQMGRRQCVLSSRNAHTCIYM
jgi:copper chaperone CopZ